MTNHTNSLPLSGKLAYSLTNNYLFRASIQKNPEAPKRLVAALLDIRLLPNNNTQLNLEMQVGNLGNWTMRSVYYLSRLFTNLQSGMDYNEALPSIHIGILTQTLFPEQPQFYSANYLMDRKTHRLYTGNFGIHVLDLSQINNVSKEEKNTPAL